MKLFGIRMVTRKKRDSIFLFSYVWCMDKEIRIFLIDKQKFEIEWRISNLSFCQIVHATAILDHIFVNRTACIVLYSKFTFLHTLKYHSITACSFKLKLSSEIISMKTNHYCGYRINRGATSWVVSKNHEQTHGT